MRPKDRETAIPQRTDSEISALAMLVLNWNGLELLRQFLPKWLESVSDERAELIIADNGSTDGSVDYIREHAPHIRIIELGYNYGFAEGYNRAIAEIDHPYVVLLNSDAYLRPGWVNKVLEYMRRRPDVGALQPKLLYEREPSQFEYAGASGGYIDVLGYPFCRGRIFDTVEEDCGQYNDQRDDLLWGTGACLIVRREVYERLGGLDSDFFAHQEEIDLCWRMVSRGWRIACLPEVEALHVGGASLEAGNPRKIYLNFRNNLLLLYKNLPTSRLFPTLLLRFPLDMLAGLRFLFSQNRKGFGSVLRAWWDFVWMHRHFRDKRKKNLRAMVCTSPSGIRPYSVLIGYYIRGRKTFSALES